MPQFFRLLNDTVNAYVLWRGIVSLHFLVSAQGTLFGKGLKQCNLQD